MKIAVIGGGAAGFFAAISVKEHHPKSDVHLLEKTNKLLSKVRISGGGRCNVTNGCENIKQLTAGYPRGAKQLKKAFQVFDNKDTWLWYESRGVTLKTELDNRVFPTSNNSQSIIDCLQNEISRLGITIIEKARVKAITEGDNTLVLTIKSEELIYDKVIVACGGSPKKSGLYWLESLGHKIENPVPSLFTFNMPNESITELMGVVASNATVNVQGTKSKSSGPLLITHWGMSGPAILKLSAHGARILSDKQYTFVAQVNWISISNNEDVSEALRVLVAKHSKKHISNIKPFGLPTRLWNYILSKCEISLEKPWGDIGKKQINKLVTHLTNDIYNVKGKTTFKEEFVTCGGVSLESIDINTMQSRHVPNLYFAGEVMNIDGITGGYNFQAAWTTAFIAGKLG